MRRVKDELLTALVLTYNEEANIGRVLDQLGWLECVIVLDSNSTDATRSIVQRYSNVRLFRRDFDSFASQWNYGLSLVQSKWVLSLDADYILTPEFVKEVCYLIDHPRKVAYATKFRFAVFGKPLRRNNTTPRPVLFLKTCAIYYDDGHTQRLRINGDVGSFRSYIIHDDRKPLTRWMNTLNKYSVKECAKMMDPQAHHANQWVLRIRRTKVFAPFFVFFYCLFVNGALLDGWHGWHYTLQRTLVEILFALRLIEEQNLRRLEDYEEESIPPEPGAPETREVETRL